MEQLEVLFKYTIELLAKLKKEQAEMKAKNIYNDQSRCVALAVTNTEAALWALREAIDPIK
jgi:hypothetical protein